ncbi:MAG TPA: protein kinase [Polyangia bacterium]|nr:protein kinase [Polyangia bacterium]
MASLLGEHGLHRFPSMTGGLWDLISTQGMRSGADSEQVTHSELPQGAVCPPAPDTQAANSNAVPAPVLTREAAKRFEYVNQVGAGGMGAVHCVRDKNLLREVAIKVLAPSLADDSQYVRRFLAEAQIQAQLNHPNIAPVHDLAMDHEGTNYFTMRLVHGRTLADWIASARLSPTPSETMREMLGAFLKVCDAVAFAHSRGVLHLDIKPENIIMEEFGTVYLMDWGLSRLSARDHERGDGVSLSPEAAGGVVAGVVGSPSYMSPEQAKGAEGLVSERTDVFGLGAVLYAILAGRPLYLADSMDEVLEQAREGQMPSLPDGPRGAPLPARICQITRKALAFDPEDRYQSVLELKREVEGFLQGGIAFPIETFSAGERIVSEGEMGDTAFVVVRGACDAYTTKDGMRSAVCRLGTGSVFGEETVFKPGPRGATVEAVTDVSVRLVTRKMLDEGLGQDSWFGAFVVALANRLVPAAARPETETASLPSSEVREERASSLFSDPLDPTAALLECPPTVRAGGW